MQHKFCWRYIKVAIPFARYKCTGEDSHKKGLKVIDWEGVYWMYRVQERREWWTAINPIMNFGFH
jgi:hypothetical protein